MTAVLKPWVAAVRDARAQVAKEMAGVDASISKGYRDAPAHARKGFAGATAAAEQSDKAIAKSADQAANAKIRAFNHVASIHQRYLDQEERAEEKSANKRKAMYAAVASGSARNFGGIVRAGAGIAGSIVRGAGVNFDVGSAVGRGVAAEAAATDITNSGYQPNQGGVNAQRQDPTALLAQVRSVAKDTATDTNVALEGLQKFVGKTGDLATGRDMLAELAKLSKATGTSLADMADASGDVSNVLGDVPNKAEQVQGIMRVIAGQGKLGAVEVRDLASQMAKVASTAPQFKGDMAENLAILGGLTQEARQRGGAASASQAATSTASFARDITKDKTLSKFAAANIDVFSDKKHQTLRSPEAIITDVLKKTGGDLAKIGALFPNASSKRTVTGFASIYNQANGGEAGIKAVGEEFARLKKATMSVAEEDESFKAAMATSAAKAQVFQNNLDEIAAKMAGEVLPALEKLAPKALALADALAKTVGWAAENPMSAVTVALTASIAKAAIGNAISSSLSGIIAASGPFVAVAIAGAIGKMLIDSFIDSKTQGTTNSTNQEAEELNAVGAAKAAKRTGGISKEDSAALEAEAARLNQQIIDAKVVKAEEGTATGVAAHIFGGEKQAAAENNAPRLDTMAAHLSELKTIMAAIKSGTIQVRVMNPTVPGVDPAGRKGP